MPAIRLSIPSLAATQMTNNGSIRDEELSNQVITTTESCMTCFFLFTVVFLRWKHYAMIRCTACSKDPMNLLYVLQMRYYLEMALYIDSVI